jgi:hypothetical protein
VDYCKKKEIKGGLMDRSTDNVTKPKLTRKNAALDAAEMMFRLGIPSLVIFEEHHKPVILKRNNAAHNSDDLLRALGCKTSLQKEEDATDLVGDSTSQFPDT